MKPLDLSMKKSNRKPKATNPPIRKRKATNPTIRKRQPKKKETQEETWIEESRTFPRTVMSDTMRNLQEDTENISPNDRQALQQLELLWAGNYDFSRHNPESHRLPPPAPPSSPQSQPDTATPSSSSQPQPDADQICIPDRIPSVNVHTLDDDHMVINRIHIPQMRREWRCRVFEVRMPAFVLKKRILDTHFTDQLVESVMEASDEEGTAILQDFVDRVLALKHTYTKDGTLIVW